MLLPVVLLVTVIFSGTAGDHTRPALRRLPRMPAFLIGFALLAGANTAGLLPTLAATVLPDLSTWCFVAAVVAIGARTSLRALRQVGGVAIGMLVAEALFLGLGVAVVYFPAA